MINERSGVAHGVGCGRNYLHRQDEACICGLDKLADERDALQQQVRNLLSLPTDGIELMDGQGGFFTPTRPDALKVVLEYQIPAFKARIQELETNRQKAETAKARAEAAQAQLSIALRLLVDYEDELWTYVGCPEDLEAFARRSLTVSNTYKTWCLMVEALDAIAGWNREGFCMVCGMVHDEKSDCIVAKAVKASSTVSE